MCVNPGLYFNFEIGFLFSKNSLPFVTQTTLNKKKMNKTSYSKNKHIKTNSDFSNYPKTFYLTQNPNFFSENNLNVDFSNCSKR